MKFYKFLYLLRHKKLRIPCDFMMPYTPKNKREAKLPMDITFYGRSMVEMLGVLAIIGVLSVGAIAGYSKAMFKYKLNKQTEQINSLLNYSLTYKDTLHFSGSSQIQLLPYFIKLNIIPTEMIDETSDIYLKDIFGNTVGLYYYPNYKTGGLALQLKDQNAVDICINLLQIAKENRQEIYDIVFNGGNSSQLFGDKYCSSTNSICLKNLNIEQMHQYCSVIKNNSTTWAFYFRWKN